MPRASRQCYAAVASTTDLARGGFIQRRWALSSHGLVCGSDASNACHTRLVMALALVLALWTTYLLFNFVSMHEVGIVLPLRWAISRHAPLAIGVPAIVLLVVTLRSSAGAAISVAALAASVFGIGATLAIEMNKRTDPEANICTMWCPPGDDCERVRVLRPRRRARAERVSVDQWGALLPLTAALHNITRFSSGYFAYFDVRLANATVARVQTRLRTDTRVSEALLVTTNANATPAGTVGRDIERAAWVYPAGAKAAYPEHLGWMPTVSHLVIAEVSGEAARTPQACARAQLSVAKARARSSCHLSKRAVHGCGSCAGGEAQAVRPRPAQRRALGDRGRARAARHRLNRAERGRGGGGARHSTAEQSTAEQSRAEQSI
jgi:hypothetical protein